MWCSLKEPANHVTLLVCWLWTSGRTNDDDQQAAAFTPGAPTAGGSDFSLLHNLIMPANVRRHCIRSPYSRYHVSPH